ncbi:MAG: hypothetical protein E7616_07970 [Ruminococcaceae bacterium]|nr:hypothetical protein [Oscillospiraceae bacterium]
MNLLKKWKNGLSLCLLLVLTLSSCGGAMPKNTPPSEMPEVQTPSLPSDTVTPEDPTVDPVVTHQALHEVMMRYLNTYFTDREGYVPCEAVNNVCIDVDNRDTLNDILGEPHYKGSVYPPINKKFFCSVQIYILEDGSIFEVGFGDYKDSVKSVYMGSLQEYLIRISENWTPQTFIVNSDPSETYAMLYEELSTHQYMHISDRKDFIDKEVAKKLWCDSTAVEIEALLGEPHFLQIEEKRAPISGSLSEFRFYVLSDGTVLYLEERIDRSQSGYLSFYNASVILRVINAYLNY